MKKESNTPSHITRGNIFDDLGFSPGKATALKVKADLFRDILKHAKRFTQSELQSILEEPQPRISELLHSKISKVSIEKLISYAVRLGSTPQIRIRADRPVRVRKTRRLRLTAQAARSRAATVRSRG